MDTLITKISKPHYVCHECGEKFGKNPQLSNTLTTHFNGTCDLCKIKAGVSHVRNYGRIDEDKLSNAGYQVVDFKINHIYLGDSISVLKAFPGEVIDCCVTSPPYWNLRDYKSEDQLGLEPDFHDYIHRLCDVFDEVHRVLKDEGHLWVNIGDTYFSKGRVDYKKQCLVGIPERFMLEMINRGWILRNKVVWHKPNAFPTSVRNRLTVDYENLYFFVKKKGYYFKQQFEPMSPNSDVQYRKQLRKNKQYNSKDPYKKNLPYSGGKSYKHDKVKVQSQASPNRFWEDDASMERQLDQGRNKRCVWSLPTKPSKTKHIAVFPQELIESPIDAGCPDGGVVLDPFMGSGTTALEAQRQGKHFVGIELNEDNYNECCSRLGLT